MSSSPVALYQSLIDDLSYITSSYSEEGVPTRKEALRFYAAESMRSSILKKFAPESASTERADKAKALFIECNDRCGSVNFGRSDLVAQMRYLAYKELPALDWTTILSDMRPGPGASVSSQGANSFFEKLFINVHTTTDTSLYGEYLRFMNQSSTWRSAELRRIALNNGDHVRIVEGSNLTTVPKTNSIDRTICTEPSLNMLFQLALGEQLNKVLHQRYGYSPALQPDRNRRMARAGSQDGTHATIDLTSASDTISLKLIEAVLPDDWIAAIYDCRSPSTRIDGNYVKLNMVSSMGNGFTFPLQTYLFSLMLRAYCLLHDVKFSNFSEEKFGVFGDDIVVPNSLFGPILACLSELGFLPNSGKSYGAGPFRESCGSDWFDGVDVRGVYCKRLKTVQDTFSLINRLNRWSAKHGVLLTKTVSLLLPVGWRSFSVPLNEGDAAGIKFCLKKAGWYRPFRPRTKLVRFMRKEMMVASLDNPLGIWLAASIGALRSGGLSRRPDSVRYDRISVATPNWGCDADLIGYGLSFAEWEVYTSINLTS